MIDDLDPGIRNVVTLLNQWGYQTTDSGDGVSKFRPESRYYGSANECALDYPHVVIQTARDEVLFVADRLYRQLRGIGVPVGELTGDSIDAYQRAEFSAVRMISVQATYSPADGVGIVELSNLDDEGLAKWRKA